MGRGAEKAELWTVGPMRSLRLLTRIFQDRFTRLVHLTSRMEVLPVIGIRKLTFASPDLSDSSSGIPSRTTVHFYCDQSFSPFRPTNPISVRYCEPPSQLTYRRSGRNTINKMADKKQFTYEELSTHTGKKDLYLSIHGTVYDVTAFIDEHP